MKAVDTATLQEVGSIANLRAETPARDEVVPGDDLLTCPKTKPPAMVQQKSDCTNLVDNNKHPPSSERGATNPERLCSLTDGDTNVGTESLDSDTRIERNLVDGSGKSNGYGSGTERKACSRRELGLENGYSCTKQEINGSDKALTGTIEEHSKSKSPITNGHNGEVTCTKKLMKESSGRKLTANNFGGEVASTKILTEESSRHKVTNGYSGENASTNISAEECSTSKSPIANGYGEVVSLNLSIEECSGGKPPVANGISDDTMMKKTVEEHSTPKKTGRVGNGVSDEKTDDVSLQGKQEFSVDPLISLSEASSSAILLSNKNGRSNLVDSNASVSLSSKNRSSCSVVRKSSDASSTGATSSTAPGGEMLKASLESLTESELRMERGSEGRKSKSSIDGFNGSSVRSRLDTDTDLEDLLPPQSAGERLMNGGYDNLQVDSGVESAASSWDRMSEAREQACARLQDELRQAQRELRLRDEEVARLTRIRDDVEAELEELTASLFQEAHNMVREANVRRSAAERALQESLMQTDVLKAEVSALKTLVLTSTPSRPNPHLHPQIDPRTTQKEKDESSNNGLFRKQHRRSPSHFNLKYGRESSPPDSPTREQQSPQHSDSVDSVDLMEMGIWTGTPASALSPDGTFLRQVDPNLHREFLAWKQAPTMSKGDPFVARIYREEISACLEFNNEQLAVRVREAIENGSICIEAASDKTKTQFPKKCALLESTRQCHYRMRFDDCDQMYCISQLCRNRITAVCNFLNYLRYIQRGLVKSSVHDMYWEMIRLRKEIALARLGLTLSP